MSTSARPEGGAKAGASGISISSVVDSAVTDRELRLYRQLGLDHIIVYVRDTDDDSYGSLERLFDRVRNAGFTIDAVSFYKYYNEQNEDTTRLGLPGRDKLIEDFRTMLRNLGRLRIPLYMMAGWLAHRTHSYRYASRRPRAMVRGCDCAYADYSEIVSYPQAYDREYPLELMWETHDYFMRAVMPAAEESGVRVAQHPWIAVPTYGGVGNIFHSFDAMKRAVESVGSPNYGFTFCMGEMSTGARNGLYGDMAELIRYWGERQRIYLVHFRNNTDCFPNPYCEAFPELGFMDMYKLMRTLVGVGYRGSIEPDHLPDCEVEGSSAGHGVGRALNVGYLRGLLEAAEKEALPRGRS